MNTFTTVIFQKNERHIAFAHIIVTAKDARSAMKKALADFDKRYPLVERGSSATYDGKIENTGKTLEITL